MMDVEALFVGVRFRTEIWFADKAMEALLEACDGDLKIQEQFLLKLEHYAESGFGYIERNKGGPIRHEWEGAYRVRYRKSSLARLIGFYETDHKRCFFGMDAFKAKKRGGSKLSRQERRVIDEVARIKREGLWRKVRNG